VSRKKDIISFEASILELLDSLFDVVVDENGLWDVEEEFGDSNPDCLLVRGTLVLQFESNRGVSLLVTLHAVNPDHGDLLATGCAWSGQNDGVGKSQGCDCGD